MIRIRNLVKQFGPVRAVDGIDLDVESGVILGLLGPNGAGKTTTLRILTGFLPPTCGLVRVGGLDLLEDPLGVRRLIGYLPENNPLYPELSVFQQLDHFGRLYGLDRATRRSRIGSLADRCSLQAILHRPIGNLSKGNRQRVGLAQALIHDPPLLILDEPTSGLDPTQITEFRRLIAECGKTVLLSTHILPEVERTCHELAIFHRGRLVARGTPRQLTDQARKTSRLVIETRVSPETIAAALHEIPQIGEIETRPLENGWAEARIRSESDSGELAEQVGSLLIARQWPLRSLHAESGSLEAYFVQITSRQATEAA